MISLADNVCCSCLSLISLAAHLRSTNGFCSCLSIFIHIHPHIHPFTTRCIFIHLHHAFIARRNHHQQHQGSCFEMLSRQLSPFTAYSSIFIHIFIHLRHATYLSTYTTLSMAAETTVSSTRARVLRCYQGNFVRNLFFSCLESCYQGSFVRDLF